MCGVEEPVDLRIDAGGDLLSSRGSAEVPAEEHLPFRPPRRIGPSVAHPVL
jgi:hypothetical protein